jgi:hypothetical protein
MYRYLLTPDSLPNELRDFFTSLLSSIPARLRSGQWFLISEIFMQLFAHEFGVTASCLPSDVQRSLYDCLPDLLGVAPEILHAATVEFSREYADMVVSDEPDEGNEEDGEESGF